MRVPLVLLPLLFGVLAKGSVAQEQTRPPFIVHEGFDPFLTAVDEPENEGNIHVVQIPTAELRSTEGVYFDVPFALNAPFDVPFASGPVRIYADLVIESDPPQALGRDHLQRWELQTHGFYRQDRAAIPEGALVWQRNSEALALRKHERSAFPLLVSATAPPKPDTRGYYFRGSATYVPRPPFQEPGQVAIEREGRWFFEPGMTDWNPYPFVLEGSTPGVYVFWVALQPYFSQRGWPRGLGEANEFQVKITTSVVVVRSDKDIGPWHFQYLFGRRARFPEMPDDELCRVFTRELRFRVVRNAWVFDRVEVIEKHDSVKGDATVTKAWSTIYKTAPHVKTTGAQVEVSATSKIFEEKDGAELERGTLATGWTVQFPREIPDSRWGDVLVSGYRERQPEDLYPRTPPWSSDEWWRVSVEPEHGPISGGPHWLETFVEPNDVASEFRGSYGDDPDLAGAWFEQKWAQPVRGGEPLRYRLRGATPMYVERQGTLGERKHWPPLIVVDCDAWEIRAHYRRKKDVRATGNGGVADSAAGSLVEELDPFWDWYVELCALLADRMAIYHAALLQCGTIGMALEDHRRAERNLATLSVESLLPQMARERIEKRIAQTLDEIHGLREEFDRERGRAEEALTAIRAELEKGYGLYVRTHPEIALWRDRYRDLEERLPLEFVLLERDEDRAAQVLENAAVKGLSAPARLFEAELRLDRGDVIGALQALRSAKTLAPEDPEVTGALLRIESEILKTMLRKSQSGIQEGREALYTYLKRRGFREQASGDPLRWYHFLTRPLHALTSEESWSGFTSGLLDLMGGALGTANEVERLLDARQTELARAYLGLHLILRLRMRGVTFAELRGLSTDAIFQKAPLREASGEAYPPSRARDLAVCLREALQLPDVKALVEEDWPTLALELKKGYWNERDLRETGAEWIGDLFSMKNVLLFAVPMSYGRIGGRLAGVGYWGANTQRVVAVANELKLVQSGTEVLARLSGFARLVELAGATRAGKHFANMLQASAAFEQSLTTTQSAAWTMQKLIAGMVIQGCAVQLAEAYGGPQAALAMEALLILSTDGEFLLKMLKRGGGNPQAAAAFVRKQLVPKLESARGRAIALSERQQEFLALRAARQQKLLPPAKPDPKLLPPAPEVKLIEERLVQEARARSTSDEVLAKLKKGEKLSDRDRASLGDALDVLKVRDEVRRALAVETSMSPQDFELIQRVMGLDWRKRIPRGLADEDLEIAILAGLEDLAKGQDRGAMRAAERMSKEGRKLVEEAEQRLKEAQQLADLLGSAPYPPTKAPRVYLDDIPGWVAPRGNYKRAEEALHANDFARAKELYTQHMTDMLDDTMREFDEVRLALVERKIKLCDELLADATKIALPTNAHPTSLPIDENAVDEILSRGFRPIKQESNRVISKSVDGEFYLKEMDCSTPDNLANALEEAEGELGAYELGRALGLDVPATTVRVQRGPNGEIVNVQLLSKAIGDGTKLSAKGNAEIFKYHEQLSRLRALSTWLGDFDRHLGNYIPLGNGTRVFSMDHGYAGLRKHRAQAFMDHYGRTPDAGYEGYFGRDHFLERGFESAREAFNLRSAAGMDDAAKAILHEQALTYNAAEPIVSEIKRLISNQGEPELREILERVFSRIYGGDPKHEVLQGMVGEALHHLRTRGARVEDLMKGLNDRNGIPLPGMKTGFAAPRRVRGSDPADRGLRLFEAVSASLGRAA
ncbi:MAG: hypothetical protein JNM84_21540 [Planctomycetes bacterium]|nr:hypothetical protein [Planctomycetota bacterium]